LEAFLRLDLTSQGVPLYDCLIGLKSLVLAPAFRWACTPAIFWVSAVVLP